MAKVAIRKCDRCDNFDSEDCLVRRASVAGPAFDLCASCRVALLIEVGVNEEHATEYVAQMDAERATVGAWPTIDRWLKDRTA